MAKKDPFDAPTPLLELGKGGDVPAIGTQEAVSRVQEKLLYADRDVMSDELVNLYALHVSHMTSEGLHSKADIAAELAHRDMEINTLKARVAQLEEELEGVYQDQAGASI